MGPDCKVATLNTCMFIWEMGLGWLGPLSTFSLERNLRGWVRSRLFAKSYPAVPCGLGLLKDHN